MSIQFGGFIFMLFGAVSVYYGLTKKHFSMDGLKFRLIFGGIAVFFVGLILMLS